MSRLALHGGPAIRKSPFPPQSSLGDAEREAVLDVFDSGILSQFLGEYGPDFFGGPRVRACEEAFASRFDVRAAVTINSATTGLQVAFQAAGLEPGDEVIVTPFTMSATAAAIVLNNAIPVFADVEDATYGLDPAAVDDCVTARTRAIAVTHLFGHPARMQELLDVAARRGLLVIEDAAQSVGATWRGRPTGTLGTVGVLSLNYHKIIQTGEGGIVMTDDPQIADRARFARNHGEAVVADVGVRDIANTIGSNYRLGEIEAAIAVEQLKRLDELLAHRQQLAARLRPRLAGIPGVVPAAEADGCTHAYYVFAVRLERDLLDRVDRAAVAAALVAEGIPVAEGYVKPLYLQPMYQQRVAHGSRGCPWTCGHWGGIVSYEQGICPVAERLHDSELLLLDVCRAPLTERDVDDVADAFEKVFENVDLLRAASTAP